MPAKITGAAIGSCMRVRIWLPDSPIPRAASMMPWRPPSSPVEALMRIGGYRQRRERDERRVEAEAEEGLAERQDGEDGTARPMLPMLMASAAPREVFLIAAPRAAR